MKFLWIGILILFVIMLFCTMNFVVVRDNLNEISDLLDEAEAAVLAGDLTTAEHLANIAAELWESNEVYYSVVFYHDSIHSVKSALNLVVRVIKTGDPDDILHLVIGAKTAVSLVLDEETLSFGNVF